MEELHNLFVFDRLPFSDHEPVGSFRFCYVDKGIVFLIEHSYVDIVHIFGLEKILRYMCENAVRAACLRFDGREELAVFGSSRHIALLFRQAVVDAHYLLGKAYGVSSVGY